MTTQDFWRDSGWALLEKTDGRLGVTDAYLAAYAARPELAPPDDACAAERALHARLIADPRTPMTDADIAAIADADAQENFTLFRAHRDALIADRTLESRYLAAARGQNPPPPLFADHMAQAILRDLLEGETDPLVVRAAELLFRAQRATVAEGRVRLADKATVDMLSATGGFGDLGRLIAEAQTPMREVALDVLTRATADAYWDRSERFDTVIDVTFGQPGLDALARVIERWIARFFALDANAQPVAQIRDEKWRWHIGLDVEANALLNALYAGEAVDDERIARILALFRLEIGDASALRPDMAGRPIYLGLAMTAGGELRMKPQNLLVNLPLAQGA